MTARALSPVGVPAFRSSKTNRGWNVIVRYRELRLRRATWRGVFATTNIGVELKENAQGGASGSCGGVGRGAAPWRGVCATTNIGVELKENSQVESSGFCEMPGGHSLGSLAE